MKTPVPLLKLTQAASKGAAICHKVSGQFFGNVSWQRPGWINRIGNGWDNLNRRHPRLTAGAIIVIFLLSCAGVWTLNWYQHQPKPRRVTVRVQPIEITKLEKDLKFPRLVLYFSEPAARLEDLHKPTLQGVRLEPKIGGAWHWASGDILVFEPTQDWPADLDRKSVV